MDNRGELIWNTILCAYGDTYKVTSKIVFKGTSSEIPLTGPYYSKYVTLTKPTSSPITKTATITSNSVYIDSTTGLIPGQCVEYNLNVGSAGLRWLQTNSSYATSIAILKNGVEVAAYSGDDYEGNALLYYNFDATTNDVTYTVRVGFTNPDRNGNIDFLISSSTKTDSINSFSHTMYYEDINTLTAGQIVVYTFRSENAGIKLLQTMGQDRTVISIFKNGVLEKVNTSSGYEGNALLSYNFDAVSSGNTYTIMVHFLDIDKAGNIKLTLTPANGASTTPADMINSYGQIATVTTNAPLESVAEPYYTKVARFVPTTTGSYTIELEDNGASQTYLAVIDLTLNTAITIDNTQNGGGGAYANTQITMNMEAGHAYLIVYSRTAIHVPFETFTLTVMASVPNEE